MSHDVTFEVDGQRFVADLKIAPVRKMRAMKGDRKRSTEARARTVERRRQRELKHRACWNCGGSGMRCCEFGADR